MQSIGMRCLVLFSNGGDCPVVRNRNWFKIASQEVRLVIISDCLSNRETCMFGILPLVNTTKGNLQRHVTVSGILGKFHKEAF